MRRLRSHYDAAWKEIVRFLFRPLMLLCFPAIAAHIDWLVAIEFLNTELQSIAPRSRSRRRQVDTLVRVRFLDGGTRLPKTREEHPVSEPIRIQETTPHPILAAANDGPSTPSMRILRRWTRSPCSDPCPGDATTSIQDDSRAGEPGDPVSYCRDGRKHLLLQENGCRVRRFLAADLSGDFDVTLDAILRTMVNWGCGLGTRGE
jgi:hypothetical protein